MSYSNSVSSSDNRQLAVDGKQFLLSDAEANDCRRCHAAGPLLAGIACESLTTTAAPAAQPAFTVLSDSGNQRDMELVCLEAASVEALTTDTDAAAAAADDDDDDDDVISCDSLYHVIHSNLCLVDDASEKNRLCNSLLILLRFYEAEYLAGLDVSSSSSSFPLYLMDQYTRLVNDDVGFYSSDG